MDFQPRRLTCADYQARNDSDHRCELLDGHFYAMGSPSAAHQSIVLSLALQLGPQLAAGPCRLWLSPFDVKLSEHDLVQPDLFISCDPDRIRPGHLEGPPDLIIEVLSTSTLRHDRVRKLNLYARCGVKEYWLVTPHPFLIEVMRNVSGMYTVSGTYTEEHELVSPVFPQLKLELASVLANLPPQPPIDEVREVAPAFG